jgi:hypothetical protein
MNEPRLWQCNIPPAEGRSGQGGNDAAERCARWLPYLDSISKGGDAARQCNTRSWRRLKPSTHLAPCMRLAWEEHAQRAALSVGCALAAALYCGACVRGPREVRMLS